MPQAKSTDASKLLKSKTVKKLKPSESELKEVLETVVKEEVEKTSEIKQSEVPTIIQNPIEATEPKKEEKVNSWR